MKAALFRNKINVGIAIAIGSILLSLSTTTQTFAYDEPDNFAGLKFGEDIRPQVARCLSLQELIDKYQRSGNLEKFNEERVARCYNPVGKLDIGELRNVGEISRMVTKIFYEQVNNKLERIELNFSSRQAEPLLTVLKQRYGEPTSAREEPWQSQGGAKTTSTHAEWQGKNVSIVFDQRTSKIDEGQVQYTTSAYSEYARQKMQEQIKKAAGGL